MSTTVDSKVVEMRFDNRHFESNVSTTMSTLDKLKAKLGFDGATKGLENVSSAAKKIDMNPIGSAVQTVQAKFSALDVIAVTALTNITNSAVNAGKRIVSALTIDPVKTGFNEYEMKMDSVKTIVNSTGRDLADVNKLLEELNEYSDQTIYSFKDMTSNIGKFTNAGVGLEEAVLAIKGISNEAAVSGANATEAARAMYNFSQALSSGYVKLIDWKSIENANMATKEFKQQLIDTAVELGVVTQENDMYVTASGKSFNATKNFNDCLQEQWMTNEVLIKTLGKYADTNTDIGKKAFAAAQEVTKLTQMYDVLKETAQSGWARTWELIIGDLNTAKKIFTPLTNFFSNIINTMSDWRNRILQIALDFMSPWSEMVKKIGNITEAIGSVGDKIAKVAGSLTDFQDIVNKVWRGDFNNWGDNPDRRDLLTDAGWDYRVVQELVNKGHQYKLTMEDVEAAHKKFGLTLDKNTDSIDDNNKKTETVLDHMNDLTEARMKEAGFTEEEIRLYRALSKEADRLGISVAELGEEMAHNKGRDMLIESFKNIGGMFIDLGKAAKTAWVEVFNPPGAEEIGVRLYGIIRTIRDFTQSLRMVDEKTGELTKTGQKFQRVFKGIFAAVHIVLTIISGPLKIAFKILTQLLSVFGIGILDVAAFIGDGIVALDKWLTKVLDFTGVFEKIVNPIKNAIATFKEWIKTLKTSENLPQDIAKGIASGFSKMVKGIINFFKNLPRYIKEGFDSAGDSPLAGFIAKLGYGLKIAGQTVVELGKIVLKKINKFLSAKGFKTISEDAIAGLANGFKEGASKVWKGAVNLVKTLVEKVKSFLGIHSPSKVFYAIGGFMIAGLIAGLTNGIPDSLGAIKDVFQPMLDWINGIDLGAVLAGTITIGGAVNTYKALDALQSFTSMFEGVGELLASTGYFLRKTAKSVKQVIKGFAKIERAVAFDITMEGVQKLVTSVLLLVAAIVVLTFIDTKKLWNAVLIILVLSAILAGLAYALSQINKASMSFNFKEGLNIQNLSAGVIGIGLAVLMLAMAVKMIGKLDPDQAARGVTALIGLITAFSLFLVAFMKIPFGPADAKIIEHLGKTMRKIAVALLIMAIVVKMLGKMDTEVLKQGCTAIVLFTALIVGLMAATKLISGSKHVDTIGKTLFKIGLTFLAMAIAVKMLGKMDKDVLKQGSTALVLFTGIIVGLMAATKLISGSKNVGKIGGTLFKIGLAFLAMALAVKILGKMDEDQLKKGLNMIIAFGGIIVALMAATRLISGSKNIGKMGVTILAVAGAIAIMAFTAFMLSMISWQGFAKGTTMITLFSGIIVGLMAATKLIGKNADKLGKSILQIAGAIAIIALVAVLLSLVPTEYLVKGFLAITAFAAIIAGLIFVSKFAKKDNMKTILAITIGLVAVIVALGVILILLSKLPAQSVIMSAIALGGLLLVVAGVLKILSTIGRKSKTALKGVWALTALAVPLAAFAGILIAMKLSKNSIENAAALGILALVMSGVVVILSKIKVNIKDAIMGALALTALAVPLAAFVGVLMLMQNVKNAMSNALVLVVLATVMTILLIPLTIVGAAGMTGAPYLGALALLTMAVPLIAFVGVLAAMQNIKNAMDNAVVLTLLATAMTLLLIPLTIVGAAGLAGLPYLGALALLTMAVPLIAFVGVLAAMQNVKNAMSNALVLTLLATAMTLLLIPLTVVGALCLTGIPLLGVLALTAMVVPLEAFVSVLALMQNIKNAIPNAIAIATLMTAMSDALLKISLAAPLAVIAVGALTLLLTVIGVVGVVVTAIGGLMKAVPQLETFLDKGLDILVKIAEGLGRAIGAFVSAAFGEILPNLPGWGLHLSAFMTNLAPFINGAKNIDENVNKGVKYLTSAIMSLVGANLAVNLTSLLGMGLPDLALELSNFGSNLLPFMATVGTLTPQMLAGVETLADVISVLSESRLKEGIANLFSIGGSSLEVFAKDIPLLGKALSGFMLEINSFSEGQLNTVKCAAKAVHALASVADEIPNTGGLGALFTGENDLGVFASRFPILGHALNLFIGNIGTFTPMQVETVNCAAKAVVTLSKAAADVPKYGGLGALFAGENDIGAFASKLPILGGGLYGFIDSIGTFTTKELATVNAAIEAVKAVTKLANANLGSASANIEGFSSKLPQLALAIDEFWWNLPGEKALKECANSLDILIAAIEKISKVNSSGLATLGDNLGKIGKNAVDNFVKAFSNKSVETDLKNAAENLADKAVDGLESGKSDAKTAGKNLGAGYIKGINAKKKDAYNAGYALGKKAAQGINDGQKSNSPSRLAAQSGEWLGEGYIIGMGNVSRQVGKAGNALGETATNTLSSTISRISDLINADIDSQPTIRPILDLSDVKTGTAALNSMLDMNSRVGVNAHIGSISAMMNSRNQNGANDDVVSAINKLNNRMDNIGNTTYQINGVTYDDGSNITEAVRTIVHAAQIERRI